MIKNQLIEMRYRPVIVCDICNKIITDAGLALAVFHRVLEEPKEGEWLDVLHVHKGNCWKVAEKKLGEINILDIELTAHLLMLIYNAGSGLEKLQKIAEMRHKFPL